MTELARRIRAARGGIEADLLLRNGRIVNVFSHEVMEADVAIHEGRFLGWGAYRAREIIHLEGRYLVPGFIDGHCHIESSMLAPESFARAVLPRGTTTVVADPHEIANVHGLEGIRYMAGSMRGVPMNLYLMLPSCVPATSMETSGACLKAEDLVKLMAEPWALGLGEVMNFPGVVHAASSVVEKIHRFSGRVIDGHAPGLLGEKLNAYLSAGIRSDHESTSLEEAREKLRKGMWIMIREGTAARNLEALLPLVHPDTSRRCLLVTDDRHPEDLLSEGHLDFALRKAVFLGLDPITAIQMVTLNPADYFGLHDLGAIAPGYRADAVVLDGLKELSISMVIKDGKVVVREGRSIYSRRKGRETVKLPPSFRVAGIPAGSLTVRARGKEMHVIGILPDQIVTQHLRMGPRVEGGLAVADPEKDLLKIAVVERHRGTGHIGVGFVRGFGLKQGALASSVAHDSHNILCVGLSDSEMLRAIGEIVSMKGGQVVVEGGQVVERLSLPIGGLMSPEPVETVAGKAASLRSAARERGCTLRDPFMTLSFLALPVIPHLKITDRGLVDVDAFRFIPLFGSG